MTVLFSKLQVRNFRSCIVTEFPLEAFTPLVGRNNCGKSNCLTALQWLVRKATLGDEDFNDKMQPVEVIGDLTGIKEADLATLEASHRRKIEPFVRDGKLRIRRSQDQPKGSVVLDIWSVDEELWKVNPAGIDAAFKALFPDPIRIGAMEDAEEDVSKAKTSTTIGKLLAEMLGSIRGRHEADLNKHLNEIADRLSAAGPSRFEELSQIDESINAKIADLFPGISVRLDFPVPALEDLIKTGTVKVYEGGDAGRSFGAYGHGAQRAIQMALVRHLADVKRGLNIAGGATLLLVDEPELYLHPFAVEHVREALRVLSTMGYQIVFTTHSGQMITSGSAKDSVILNKSLGGTVARPRIRDAIERHVQGARHQMEQLFTLTNSSQVLFSERVVITEGKTELRLLPDIYRRISGKTFGQAAIALVAQSGAADTPKSMQILESLGLPAKAIIDLDFGFREGIVNGWLEVDDEDLVACHAGLARLKASGAITLDENTGMPKKGVVTAARAFELLAEEVPVHIGRIAIKLRRHGVWMWSRGAIEAHLGIASKKESAWLKFQADCSEGDISNVCADYQSARELVEWLSK